MNFDLGVGVAFWLTIISTLVCVVYGALCWNHGGDEKESPELPGWVESEQQINEGL